jgi:cytidylate kinase
MHITITGNLGSGKSTICGYLRSKYGITIYSTGEVHREIARRMSKSTLETNMLMKNDHSYDHLIDDEVVRISQERILDDIIFDSRMAWHFVKKSYKVFLLVNINIAAERVLNDSRGSEEKYSTIDEAKTQLKARAGVEHDRFLNIYGIDYLNLSNYDLVLDASFSGHEMIAELIYEEAKKYYQADSYSAKVLISPRNLYPTRSVKDISPAVLDQYKSEFSKFKTYADSLVSIARYQEYTFIINRHSRAVACAIALLPFITVRIIAVKADDIVYSGISLEQYLSSASISFLRDYEEICGFKYSEYPVFIKEELA